MEFKTTIIDIESNYFTNNKNGMKDFPNRFES